MRTIVKIISVEKRKSTKGDYFVTTALLDNSDEVEGFGKGYEVGEKVESFFHDRYNRAKMRKPNNFNPLDNNTAK